MVILHRARGKRRNESQCSNRSGTRKQGRIYPGRGPGPLCWWRPTKGSECIILFIWLVETSNWWRSLGSGTSWPCLNPDLNIARQYFGADPVNPHPSNNTPMVVVIALDTFHTALLWSCTPALPHLYCTRLRRPNGALIDRENSSTTTIYIGCSYRLLISAVHIGCGPAAGAADGH